MVECFPVNVLGMRGQVCLHMNGPRVIHPPQ
jgi:hypothetical protein